MIEKIIEICTCILFAVTFLFMVLGILDTYRNKRRFDRFHLESLKEIEELSRNLEKARKDADRRRIQQGYMKQRKALAGRKNEVKRVH